MKMNDLTEEEIRRVTYSVARKLSRKYDWDEQLMHDFWDYYQTELKYIKKIKKETIDGKKNTNSGHAR